MEARAAHTLYKYLETREMKTMTITRFVPFRAGLSDMAVMQNQLNSIFSDLVEGQTEGLSKGKFVPAVDVYEDAQKVVLKLEVPGIRAEELDIRVEGRTLTVRGERKFESEQKEENFHRIERRYGSFVRSFTLPATVDTDSVDAQSADGVLTISLAKKAETKQVVVKAAAGAVQTAETPKQADSQK
jgi:HSP20 family protein